MKEENLDLAGRIASGQLDGCRLVSGLVRAFVAKVDRVARGCTQRANQSLDPNLALEFLHTVGRGKEARQMLATLGVDMIPACAVCFDYDKRKGPLLVLNLFC